MTINNITYLDQIIPNQIFISTNSLNSSLFFYDSIEIKQFLQTLDMDCSYVVTFKFVISWLSYEEDSPTINLGKPILITKNSNPQIIAKFLRDRVNLAIDCYYLDDSMILDNKEGPAIIINYSKINLF